MYYATCFLIFLCLIWLNLRKIKKILLSVFEAKKQNNVSKILDMFQEVHAEQKEKKKKKVQTTEHNESNDNNLEKSN